MRRVAPSHPAARGAAPPRPRRVTPAAGLRQTWPFSRGPDPEDALVEALRAGEAPDVIDARLDALLAATSTTAAAAAPRLDAAPWVVAHTRGPLAWRAFTLAGPRRRRPPLASQAIDTAAGTVVSRAEAMGGALLSTAFGTVAPREGDPATFDVYVTGAEVAVGAPVDGAGVAKSRGRRAAAAAGGGGGTARTLRLPIRGRGAFRVEFAGRRLRVFRGSGGLAVQVKPGVLLEEGR